MTRSGSWIVLITGLMAAASSQALAATLRGQVDVEKRQPRKVAQRYPGVTATEAREMEAIPTIAFIKGSVATALEPANAGHHAIIQRDTLFVPSHLVVPVGSSVAFPNQDDEFHNVFSYSKAKRFDLGRYPKGESKDVVFDQSGIVKIYCEIHPWMRAAVVAVDNPYFAEVGEDGTFEISNVPPGRYTLVVWNIDSGSEELEVEVPAGSDREVTVSLAGVFRADVAERMASVATLASESGDTAEPSSCCTDRSHHAED